MFKIIVPQSLQIRSLAYMKQMEKKTKPNTIMMETKNIVCRQQQALFQIRRLLRKTKKY